MKSIARMALQPGMILGEDVEYQGKKLFSADTVVDENVLERLKRYSIMCVTIKEDVDLATTHYEKIRYNEAFKLFEQKHSDSLMLYKQMMLAFATTGLQIPDDALLSIYQDIQSTYQNGSALLDFLYNLVPNEDELTFNHCLNSALLAGTFADWLSMRGEDKNALILSGFYYDIGKLKLPYDLLWKPGKLTDEEYAMVKKHPEIGYSIIRNTTLDNRIKNAVIMHHERMDGSGYPYHMKGSKIDIFAKYIAIIDTYIAMASPRAYRNALTPLQILENFERDMQKYDPTLLIPLMKRIADAQIGSTVQLNDESVWEVFVIHPGTLSRPILKNENNQILDLMENPQFQIIKNL